MATASSTCFIPMACSAMPGMGNVRVTAPAVIDDDVVAELDVVAVGGADLQRPARVLDPGHLAGDHLRAAQVLAQRDRGVPGLDRPGHHLGQERLVRHVRARVDDGDLRLVRAQRLLQVPRGVEARVATADDHDPLHLCHTFSTVQDAGT